MAKRVYYEKLFQEYPDVVTLNQFRQMLGGIADSTARKIMRENQVFHYSIRRTYYIPKTSVIDYVMSKAYARYKEQLKARI